MWNEEKNTKRTRTGKWKRRGRKLRLGAEPNAMSAMFFIFKFLKELFFSVEEYLHKWLYFFPILESSRFLFNWRAPLLEKPKSVNLTIPSFSKNTTFSGFRSLQQPKVKIVLDKYNKRRREFSQNKMYNLKNLKTHKISSSHFSCFLKFMLKFLI